MPNEGSKSLRWGYAPDPSGPSNGGGSNSGGENGYPTGLGNGNRGPELHVWTVVKGQKYFKVRVL